MAKMTFLFGRAGAGKTTYCKQFADTHNVLSIDAFFIGDTAYRNALLDTKAEKSYDAYFDACNQMNWWNWNLMEDALTNIKAKTAFIGYDRDTGGHKTIYLDPAKDTIVEGVMLHPMLFRFFDEFWYLGCDPMTRFQRLIDKDKGRRTPTELAARYLICDYSEHSFYTSAAFGELVTSKGLRVLNPEVKYESDQRHYVPMEILRKEDK